MVHRFVLCAVLLAVACGGALSQEDTYKVTFDPADLSIRNVDGFDRVTLEGCDLTGAIGDPMLPVYYAHVSIPADMDVASVRVVAAETIAIGSGYHVAPTPVPQPLGGPTPAPIQQAVYQGEYPGRVMRFVDTGSLSGYKIADVAIYPVQYSSADGTLRLCTSVEFAIALEPAAETVRIASRSEEAEALFRDDVRQLVINPDEVPESVAIGGNVRTLSTTVEYLIITSAMSKSTFQRLADWKTRKGIPAEVVDTTWIYANYTGRDDQEKIRNCIKDYWQNKGLVWVLLGGDVDIVPIRIAYASSGNYADDLPCDLYYSDLNGTWNANNDSNWGEYPADGVDMYSDVYVGRAPAVGATAIDRFINKVLQYEGEGSQPALPTDYEEKMLMLGSYLDDSTDEGVLKDRIDDESIPSNITVTKLYKRLGNLSSSTALSELRKGYNLVNHAGHGSEDVIQAGDDYIQGMQMSTLTNSPRITGVFYSLSCFSNNLQFNDCLGERFALAPGGGGFYIGNSRYGWYYVGWPDYGLSAKYDRYYWRALCVQGNYNAGRAHAKGKDLNVSGAKSDSGDRYCHYELNLDGDPETPLWLNDPTGLVVTHAASIQTGAQMFPVHVATSGGGNVSNAKVCLWKGTEVYAVGTTNTAGDCTLSIGPASAGALLVTVTKRDCLPYEASVSVTDGSVEPEIVVADSYAILKGHPYSGNKQSLKASDDNWLCVDSDLIGDLQRSDYVIKGVTTISNPSKIEVTWEGHLQRQLKLRMFVYDFSAGKWVRMPDQTVGTTDSTITLTFDTNAWKYVSPSNNRMKIRVYRWAMPAYPIKVYTDYVEWKVYP
jgi:hypothetical protein